MTAAVAAVSGVSHAAASLNTPVNHGVTFVGDFNVLGQPPLAEGERRLIVNYVTHEWFATYGIGIRQGRGFIASDTGHGTTGRRRQRSVCAEVLSKP